MESTCVWLPSDSFGSDYCSTAKSGTRLALVWGLVTKGATLSATNKRKLQGWTMTTRAMALAIRATTTASYGGGKKYLY